MLNFRLLPLLLTLSCIPAWADIYKHVDEQGNVTFTNTPLKGAQRIFVEQSRPTLIAPGTSKPKDRAAASPRVSTPSPAAFPRVDTGSQRERDVNRRRILEEELNSERRQLAERKKELAEAESTRSAEEVANPQKYVARLGRLRENLLLHEKNIVALQTELGKNR